MPVHSRSAPGLSALCGCINTRHIVRRYPEARHRHRHGGLPRRSGHSPDHVQDKEVLYFNDTIHSCRLQVWNPWVDKAKRMGDFGDDEYKRMLCVEVRHAPLAPPCVRGHAP